MRASTLLFVFVVTGTATIAFASEPGHPLDCNDWVFVKPGLRCETFIPYPCGLDTGTVLPECQPIYDDEPALYDLDGALLQTIEALVGHCGQTPLYRRTLTRILRGVPEQLAYIEDRCVSPGNGVADKAFYLNVRNFEINSGAVVVLLWAGQSSHPTSYASGVEAQRILGFTSELEIFQSYQPEPGALGFRVPYRPEGLRAADYFDTYWGVLTTPLDLSQAQPLQCSYPVTAPGAGDYLEIAAPVPTPAPGHANYVLTAVTYQGQTRVGRQSIDGTLHGRNANVLPACVVQTANR